MIFFDYSPSQVLSWTTNVTKSLLFYWLWKTYRRNSCISFGQVGNWDRLEHSFVFLCLFFGWFTWSKTFMVHIINGMKYTFGIRLFGHILYVMDVDYANECADADVGCSMHCNCYRTRKNGLRWCILDDVIYWIVSRRSEAATVEVNIHSTCENIFPLDLGHSRLVS